MKVLLIEDDPTTVEAIQLCFEIHWPEVVMISTAEGLKGLELLRREVPDVVILDLGLRDIDGIKILEEIGHFSNIPVLIISAKHNQDTIVRGLEIGADDYILKPFRYPDFLARLENVVRRPQIPQPRGKEERIIGGGLDIDLATRQVTVDGHPVELTPIEWDILYCLVKRRQRIVPITTLAKEVWKSDFVNRPTIESAISRLRAKLGDNPRAPRIIVSEYEAGYRFLKPAQH